MSIFIILSMIYLSVGFMILKKSNKKLNIVTWLVIAVGLLICYNVFISWVYTILHIPINILTITLINIVVGTGLIYNAHNSGKQKYYINLFDVIGLVLLSIFAVLICYKNFQGFNIAYETTDPSIHYYTSKCFAIGNSLLSTDATKIPYYGNFDTVMPIFYVNCGLLMKSVSSFVNSFDYYKIFVLSDSIVLWLTGAMFYASLINKCKKLPLKIILAGASMLYLYGYPLNGMEFGFSYLCLTIVVINLLIIIVDLFEQFTFDEGLIGKIFIYIALFLLIFNVYFGYYLFVPYTYSSVFLYICYIMYKRKLLFTKYTVLTLSVLLLVPFTMGCIYFLLPGIMASGETEIGAIVSEGYIYRDLYSNVIFFLPFVIYMIWNSLKSKTFEAYLSIAFLVVILILFLLGYKGKASSYYYFKNYNVLWLICFYSFIYTAIKFNKTEAINLIYGISVIYILTFASWYNNFDEKITENNLLFNPHPTMANYFDIYVSNRNNLNHSFRISNEKMSLIEKADQLADIDNLKTFPVIGGTLDRLWFLALTDLVPNVNENELGAFYEDPITVENYLENNYKYLLIYDQDPEKINKIIEENKLSIVSQNSSGILLMKNN